VVEVLEDLQALLDDGVRPVALDVGDEADAAGVVLVCGVVQAAGGGGADFFVSGGGRAVHRRTPALAR